MYRFFDLKKFIILKLSSDSSPDAVSRARVYFDIFSFTLVFWAFGYNVFRSQFNATGIPSGGFFLCHRVSVGETRVSDSHSVLLIFCFVFPFDSVLYPHLAVVFYLMELSLVGLLLQHTRLFFFMNIIIIERANANISYVLMPISPTGKR